MMETENGQDQISESESTETEHSQEVEQTQTEDGGLNPVWDPIRQELGLQFEAIKPHLREIDKGFNEGITKANSKLAPWKEFEEQGITPEAIRQSFTTLQKLNDSPEEVYAALGQFLEENGRLPKNAAEAEQALDDAADDEFQTPEAKQIAELQQKLEDMQNFQSAQVQQAQMDQLNSRAEQEVSREYSSFEAAHPELSDADKQEIYKQHYLYAASGPDNVRTLEEVFTEFNALTERVRSAPRPNDLAPRLPGAGGGVPTGQHKDSSEFTREESQDALASYLKQALGKQ
jgi:hypothetical protein